MIHQYKNNGYNIVMDVNSSSVHVVEDVVYDAGDIWQRDFRRWRHRTTTKRSGWNR